MTVETPADDEPGTPEELLEMLKAAGLGPRQRQVWVSRPSALLSGLVPGEAITNPTTAARARKAAARLIARLPEPAPAGIHVTAARIRDEGTFLLELTFAWPGGTAVRHWDAEPYLYSSRVHEPLLSDYSRFAQLHVDNRTLSWPGDLDFSPEFLYVESWTPDDGSVTGRPSR